MHLGTKTPLATGQGQPPTNNRTVLKKEIAAAILQGLGCYWSALRGRGVCKRQYHSLPGHSLARLGSNNHVPNTFRFAIAKEVVPPFIRRHPFKIGSPRPCSAPQRVSRSAWPAGERAARDGLRWQPTVPRQRPISRPLPAPQITGRATARHRRVRCCGRQPGPAGCARPLLHRHLQDRQRLRPLRGAALFYKIGRSPAIRVRACACFQQERAPQGPTGRGA